MKLICEGCEQELPVSAFRFEGGRLACICPACGRSHQLGPTADAAPPLGDTTPALAPDADPLAAPEEVCPKCISPRAPAAESCGKCGLRFATAHPEYYAPSPTLETAFRSALQSWQAPATHSTLFKAALVKGELAALARLYRIRVCRDPSDLAASDALSRIVEQTTSSALPEDRPPRAAPRKQNRMAFAAWLLLLVLGLVVLYVRIA